MADQHSRITVANLFPPKPATLTIGREINRGAWGTVSEGELNGQPVAVKKVHGLLLEAEGTDESLVHSFHRECQLLEKANHPNIVKFYGAYYDEETGEPILVMERMKENLREYLLRNKGKLSRQEAINFCLSIVRGLRYLHSLPKPIVHRYLNDKNIMISEDGAVKIGDLGQSRLKDHNVEYFNSLDPGAITYMPPEALRQDCRYNEKTDTFSVGLLMLEVATQQSPVVAPVNVNIGSVKEVLHRGDDLSKLPQDHPLKPLVILCLEDDPKKRPQSTQLYEHLNRMLLLYEYYCKVTFESEKEIPQEEITWISLELFEKMIKPQPCRDPTDQVQAAILTSAATGDLTALKELALESSQIIPLVMNKYGWTAVHFAAYNGHKEVLQVLLNTYHCDPNGKGKYKWTPLFAAARGGQIDIVKYLIEEVQCSIKTVTEDGRNLLFAAARSGNASLFLWLLDECKLQPVTDKLGESVLFPLASVGNIDLFDRMVEQFSLAPDAWDTEKSHRPVTCAAEHGHFSLVKHVFDKYNCDLKAKNKDGETLLHRAAVGDSIDLVDWLIKEHGLDIQQCTEDGWTALHYASRYGHLHIVRELVEEMDANVPAAKQDKLNALHLAAFGGHVEILKYLIPKFRDGKFDLDNAGNTCLHWATQEGHLAVVKYLVEECRFNPNLGNRNGYNALHLAACGGHVEIVKYLIPKFGDRRFDLTNAGNTCLHYAAREGHLAVVKYLIEECGFYPNLGNKYEKTPLILATKKGHSSVVEYLRQQQKY